MLTMLAGFFAKSALMQSPLGGFLKAVPRRVWIGLAVAAVIVAAIVWHQHRAHSAIAAAEKRGEDRADARWAAKIARVAKQAAALRIRAEATSAAITKQVRTNYDTQARDIAAGADALRLRGPGQAYCRPLDHPRVSGIAGGSGSAGGSADVAGPQMPAGDGAAVPWGWLVDRAEQSDLNRAEVLAWRDWYDRQRKAWDEFRSAR
jgi:hypothetical protein